MDAIDAKGLMVYCDMAKIRRNQRCPCGSGKKYKHCHGNLLKQEQSPTEWPVSPHVRATYREMQAREKRRKDAQGLGRPIISADFQGRKFVAVGSAIYSSPNWVYFSDFLLDFIKRKLGAEWGGAEKERLFEDQHPLMKWFYLMRELHGRFGGNKSSHVKYEATG